MIREEHFSFTSNQGSIKIHGMRWLPEGEVRAVMQLVHGMSEYIERYGEFARYLAGQGILVVGHDHLGHGDSAETEADYGYFAKEHGDRILVQDIHKLVCMTKKEYDGIPYILFGHSMGSFLVRKYLCCHGNELSGAVICGTGYQPEALLRAALVLCRAEAAFLGWKSRSRLMHWISFGSYNAKFRPNRTESDWLCCREEIVDAYTADKKCGFTFTLNGYYNLFLTMYKIIRKEYLEQMPKELPVLFAAGGQDPVGECGAGVQKVIQLFEKTGMKHVEAKLYPGDRHEILNEEDRYTVYADIVDWMNRNILK